MKLNHVGPMSLIRSLKSSKLSDLATVKALHMQTLKTMSGQRPVLPCLIQVAIAEK